MWFYDDFLLAHLLCLLATDQYGGPTKITKNNIDGGLTNQNSRYIPTKLLHLYLYPKPSIQSGLKLYPFIQLRGVPLLLYIERQSVWIFGTELRANLLVLCRKSPAPGTLIWLRAVPFENLLGQGVQPPNIIRDRWGCQKISMERGHFGVFCTS